MAPASPRHSLPAKPPCRKKAKNRTKVEKILSDEKSVVDRKKALIDDLLKQRDAAVKSFDEKLAKLGYRANSAKPKRSHRKKPGPPAPDPASRLGARPKA